MGPNGSETPPTKFQQSRVMCHVKAYKRVSCCHELHPNFWHISDNFHMLNLNELLLEILSYCLEIWFTHT